VPPLRERDGKGIIVEISTLFEGNAIKFAGLIPLAKTPLETAFAVFAIP